MVRLADIYRLGAVLEILVLSFPIAVVLTSVLTSRFNKRWFLKHIEQFAPSHWRRRFDWRDRKIERLIEERALYKAKYDELDLAVRRLGQRHDV